MVEIWALTLSALADSAATSNAALRLSVFDRYARVHKTYHKFRGLEVLVSLVVDIRGEDEPSITRDTAELTKQRFSGSAYTPVLSAIYSPKRSTQLQLGLYSE